jgi:outer membrane receptor protein involved in Fe transport
MRSSRRKYFTSSFIHPVPLCLSTALGVAFGGSAGAQTAPAAAEPSSELTEIVVTGSLLRRTSEENESPVTVFTAEAIKQTGLTTIADVIRTVSADNSGTIPTAFAAGFARFLRSRVTWLDRQLDPGVDRRPTCRTVRVGRRR